MIAEVFCPARPLGKYLWGNTTTYTHVQIGSLPDHLTISPKGHLGSGCNGVLAKNWYAIKPYRNPYQKKDC